MLEQPKAGNKGQELDGGSECGVTATDQKGKWLDTGEKVSSDLKRSETLDFSP
jgi:hypothetical protein